MELEELFEDYCKVGEIQIVRVSSLNTFFAVMSVEKGEKKLTMLRYIDRNLLKKLEDNQLTKKELIGQLYEWRTLQEVSEIYKRSQIQDIMERRLREGKDFNKSENNDLEENKKNDAPKSGIKNKIKSMIKTVSKVRNRGEDR